MGVSGISVSCWMSEVSAMSTVSGAKYLEFIKWLESVECFGWIKWLVLLEWVEQMEVFFFWSAPCGFRRVATLRLTRGPVPGGNRSAASCLCTVLRRALYHYTTRSPEWSKWKAWSEWSDLFFWSKWSTWNLWNAKKKHIRVQLKKKIYIYIYHQSKVSRKPIFHLKKLRL